ncbi:MAG: hypothetical protein M1826_000069 [Phylliscum demangeonii]|nr:MAG: hypothetical protein M1826_000069 [Phylliscum demangeonii]
MVKTKNEIIRDYRQEIDTLESRTTRQDVLQHPVLVDKWLRQSPSLEACIGRKIYVTPHDWNDAADHCDPGRRFPFLRIETYLLYLPILDGRPPLDQSPSEFSLLTHAQTAASHTAHRLLTAAQRGLKPLAHARFATEQLLNKAQPLEQSFVHAVQRAER